jgi:hypothetical protein
MKYKLNSSAPFLITFCQKRFHEAVILQLGTLFEVQNLLRSQVNISVKDNEVSSSPQLNNWLR